MSAFEYLHKCIVNDSFLKVLLLPSINLNMLYSRVPVHQYMKQIWKSILNDSKKSISSRYKEIYINMLKERLLILWKGNRKIYKLILKSTNWLFNKYITDASNSYTERLNNYNSIFKIVIEINFSPVISVLN